MRFGRILAGSVALRSSFRERLSTLGSLKGQIDLREAFTARKSSSGKRFLTEAHYCPNTFHSAIGYSAYPMVFVSNPTACYGRAGATAKTSAAVRPTVEVTRHGSGGHPKGNCRQQAATVVGAQPVAQVRGCDSGRYSAFLQRRQPQEPSLIVCPRCDSGHRRRRSYGGVSESNVEGRSVLRAEESGREGRGGGGLEPDLGMFGNLGWRAVSHVGQGARYDRPFL